MKILAFLRRISAFLLSLFLCSLLITLTVVSKNNIERLTMEQLILAKSARVSDVISRLVYYRTNMLSAIVVQNDDFEDDFNRIAQTLVDDTSILYVLTAPSGVISNIHPIAGNEALLGSNILIDGIGAREAIAAKESGSLVLGGPFEVRDGVQALIARLPVYSENSQGEKDFWGIVSVALKFPQIMDAIGLDELQLQGFSYEIYKTDPQSGEKQIIESFRGKHDNYGRYIEERTSILNDEWYFRIFALNPWYEDPYTWILISAGVYLSFLIARLQTMSTKAKEASKAKSDFLASMSHEIRTPMNAIIGMSELLKQEDLNGRQQEYVEDIRASSTALLGIINDILDVSKIEAGKLSIAPVHFNLPDFIENVSELMAFSAHAKNLEFILEIAEPFQKIVYGDDLRLRQVLINLLGNAVKFTDEGYVKLAVSYSDGAARFIVSDTGIGIKESDIKRLYDSFEQFDLKKNRGKQGTGLGLSITKSLVSLMGGDIQVESVFGEGTTFTLVIPMPPGEKGKVKGSGASLEVVSAKDANVLLVEDNEINRRVAYGLLKLSDIECDIAVNGVEAINKVRGKDYDIVFMDHMMPEMDGIEATQIIRRMGGKYVKGELPIIALTANIVPEARALFTASGMDDFLAKPIDKSELNRLLIKWLPEEKQKKNKTGAVLSERKESDYSKSLLMAGGIDGLNVESGLNHVSSMEDYERSLRLLGGSIPSAIDKLENHLSSGEIERFAIDIHGMKGALAINGNKDLADMAKTLELQAKDGNLEFCTDKFKDFATKLRSFGDALNEIFDAGEAGSKPDGSKEDLLDALRAIEDYVERYDRENALKEIGEISAYSFGGDVDSAIKLLTRALEDFDFDIAIDLLHNINYTHPQ